MNIIKNDKNIKRCCFGMLAISLIVHQIGWKIARRKRWREWGGVEEQVVPQVLFYISFLILMNFTKNQNSSYWKHYQIWFFEK